MRTVGLFASLVGCVSCAMFSVDLLLDSLRTEGTKGWLLCAFASLNSLGAVANAAWFYRLLPGNENAHRI